jgi:hypothetical protein
MPKVIKVAAAICAAFLLGGAAAWRPTGLPVQPGASVHSVSEYARPIPGCGGKPAAAGPEDRPPLPNAYMIANGRVFALADVLACAHRLHAARFS